MTVDNIYHASIASLGNDCFKSCYFGADVTCLLTYLFTYSVTVNVFYVFFRFQKKTFFEMVYQKVVSKSLVLTYFAQ